MVSHRSITSTRGPVSVEFDSLAARLESSMSEWDIPGAVLGVFHRDQQHTIAFGVTDLSTQAPVTTDTAFRIASLTKVFTATAIAALADPVDRPLNAPVTTWLPTFRLADADAAARVTLAQALSHSGGWIDPPWPESPDDAVTLVDAVAELAHQPQYFPPGAHFSYSNSAYQLAGHILAAHTGLAYEQALHEHVLAPLSLQNTGFFRDQFAHHTVASGHATGDNGLDIVDPWHVPAAVHPTAGLLSTVDDLLRFLRFHAGLIPINAAPLSEAQRLAMLVPRGPGGSLGPIAADSIGIGWMRAQVGGRQVAMSFGSDAGLSAAMAIVPDDQFGFAMLSNADPGLVVSAQLLVQAIELFMHSTQPEPIAIDLPPALLRRSTGRFTIPDDLTFELAERDSSLWVSAFHGEEPILDINGPLTMFSSDHGWLQMGPMKLQVDLVRDNAGMVAWIRFAARLARRDA